MDTLESALRLIKQDCFFLLQIWRMRIVLCLLHQPTENFSNLFEVIAFSSLQHCLWGLLSVQEFLPKPFSLFSLLLPTQFEQSCLDYIDDFFNTEDTLSLCQQATLRAGQHFTRLGFVIHPTKSGLHATQSLELLGFILSPWHETYRYWQDSDQDYDPLSGVSIW